ncbi:MAG TPA: hypothetical protein VLF43_04740, partial [Candidatus Saccharimonadales bacterium]|nr:hypothetical protein [Candidatus Saccharimonadales bacterium]
MRKRTTKTNMPRRITNRRLAIRLLAVVLAVGTLFVSALGPFFISRVSAAVDPETAVNLLHLPGVGTPYKVPVGSRPQLTWGTCIGSFAPQPVDITQPVIDSFKNTTAGLGQQSHNFLSDAQLATLQSELNTTQPVIEFKSAQGQDPVANGLAFKLDDTACSQYILYFIGNGTYAMPQFDPVTICSARGCTIDSNHTTRTIFFTQSGPGSNNGTLHYEVPDSSGQLSKTDVTSMVVGGNASGPAGGGGVNIGTITAKWVNAAEIDIVSGGPTTNPKGYNGEVYLKSSWSAVNVNGNPESLYFLAQEGPNADPARSGVVSGNTVECANPIPGGSQIGQQGEGCNGGASNCVPFFEVLEAINYSGSSANDQHA